MNWCEGKDSELGVSIITNKTTMNTATINQAVARTSIIGDEARGSNGKPVISTLKMRWSNY